MDVSLCQISHHKCCFSLAFVGVFQHHSPHVPQGVIRPQIVMYYHWLLGRLEQFLNLLLVFVFDEIFVRDLSKLLRHSLFGIVLCKKVTQDGTKK